MKERPIIFSSEMVKAILEGRKCQTRRVIKPQPQKNSGKELTLIRPYRTSLNQWNWVIAKTGHGTGDPFDCPYGKAGDKIEVWEEVGDWLKKHYTKEEVYKQKHIPAKRVDITLEITDIRVERLQEISEKDIKAEGTNLEGVCFASNTSPSCSACNQCTPKEIFAKLWNSLVKKGFKWEDNPWVWVISFKKVRND